MSRYNIEIDIGISEEDYGRVLLWQCKKKIIFLSGFVFAMTVIFAGSVLFFGISKPKVSLVLFTPILIPIFLVGFNIWQIFRNIRNQACDGVATTEPTKIVFSPAGLTAESNSSSSRTLWRSFMKINETTTDFVFYPQKRIFFPIPKRFFNNSEQIKQVRDFISAGVGEKERVLIK